MELLRLLRQVYLSFIVSAVHGGISPVARTAALECPYRFRAYLIEQFLFQRHIFPAEPVPLVLGHIIIGISQVLLHVSYLSLCYAIGNGNSQSRALKRQSTEVLTFRAIFRSGPVAEPERPYSAVAGLSCTGRTGITSRSTGTERLTIESLVERLAMSVDTGRDITALLINGIGYSGRVCTCTFRH